MRVSITEKLCKGCGILKPVSEFYPQKRNADGLFALCKKCCNTESREWYKKNREKELQSRKDKYLKDPQYFRDKRKKWMKLHPEVSIAENEKRKVDRKKFPDKYKDIKLRSKYGITIDDYNNMLIAQNNVCICGREFTPYPHVDHNHKTGKVRGLLCQKCNQSLGALNDDVTILEKLITYLKMNQ